MGVCQGVLLRGAYNLFLLCHKQQQAVQSNCSQCAVRCYNSPAGLGVLG